MKKIVLFILISISIFYVWKPDSKPDFKEKGSALKAALWEWERADSDLKKLEVAEKIVIYSAFEKISLDNDEERTPYAISDEEEGFALEAEGYFNDFLTLASHFEESLTLDEIEFITKDNPHSIFPRIGVFYLIPNKKKCSKFEYDRLRETYTAEELYIRGTKVGAILPLYEQKYKETYIRNLIELIKNDDSKSHKFSRLADFYYPYQSKPSKFVSKMKNKLSLFSSDEKRLKSLEGDLEKTGIKKSDLPEYVISLAAKSPDCLGKLSFGFIQFAQEGLTRERGEKILVAIRDTAKSTGTLPKSIYDIKGDVEKLYMNGHSYPFYIKNVRENTIKLFSSGKDFEEGTEDDLFIGEVSL